MSAHDIQETADVGDGIGGANCAARHFVAVVLAWRGRVGLFKRSRSVRHQAGAWHCITGDLDNDEPPMQRAARELFEETGLGIGDLELLTGGPALQLPDAGGGQPWTVHTFAATTNHRHLRLNWEHDAYRWVRPAKIPRFDGQVPWLADVLEVTIACLSPQDPSSQTLRPSSRNRRPTATAVIG